MSKKNLVQVEAPLTAGELKQMVQEKMLSGGAVVISKHAQSSMPSRREPNWENPEFTHAEISGVFAYEPMIGIDPSGKEHELSSGGYGMVFNWAAKDIGFGEFQLKRLPDGTIQVDTEGISIDFFKKFMNALLDKAVEKDRKNFKRRNKTIKNN